MKYIYRLRESHPELSLAEFKEVIRRSCPTEFVVVEDDFVCDSGEGCRTCWKQDIKGKVGSDAESEKDYEYLEAFISREGVNRLARLSERVGKSEDEVIEAALKFYEDTLNALDDGWDGLHC